MVVRKLTIKLMPQEKLLVLHQERTYPKGYKGLFFSEQDPLFQSYFCDQDVDSISPNQRRIKVVEGMALLFDGDPENGIEQRILIAEEPIYRLVRMNSQHVPNLAKGQYVDQTVLANVWEAYWVFDKGVGSNNDHLKGYTKRRLMTPEEIVSRDFKLRAGVDMEKVLVRAGFIKSS